MCSRGTLPLHLLFLFCHCIDRITLVISSYFQLIFFNWMFSSCISLPPKCSLYWIVKGFLVMVRWLSQTYPSFTPFAGLPLELSVASKALFNKCHIMCGINEHNLCLMCLEESCDVTSCKICQGFTPKHTLIGLFSRR